MNPAFIFDGQIGPSKYILNFGEVAKNQDEIFLTNEDLKKNFLFDDSRIIEIPLYFLQTNTLSKCTLVAWENFELYLSYYNSLYLQLNGSTYLLHSKLQCNTWHQLTIKSGIIKLNSQYYSIPFTLTPKQVLSMKLGQQELKCLLNIGTTSIYYPIPLAAYEYVGKFKPITSLDELSQWQPEGIPFKSRFSLKNTKKASNNQLMVCHDSGSNYIFDIGVNDNPSTYKYFHFLHTDIFIYFSHELISIPPIAWIESGHKNGTLVLGTLITEGSEGEANNMKLTENIQFYVEILVKLMEFYGFDGYLINIEAKSADPSGIIQFLNFLTHKAHDSNSKSKIIWYDSMDISGNIGWQNELNADNLVFLQNSDGFLTNYSWLKGYPEESAAIAGNEKWQVYTGTDVFGRGTWGGGGYTTYIGAQDSLSTSCCLFAPAWTYEKIAREKDFDLFIQAEKLMWSERVNVLIDIGGYIYLERSAVSSMNALNGWDVFISESRDIEVNDWIKVLNPSEYWKVTNQLVMIDGPVRSKRVVSINLTQVGIKTVSSVFGTVQVKGTGPKFDD